MKPLKPMLEQAESSSSSDDEEDRLRTAVKVPCYSEPTHEDNSEAFEKKGPTGAAGFAAKMAQKQEQRAAVAKRESVDKRRAEKTSATTPPTSTGLSRRRTTSTKACSRRRWRRSGRKRGKLGARWRARCGLPCRRRRRDRRKLP